MARRRAPRVVWLPPTNSHSLGSGSSGYQIFGVDVGGPIGEFSVGEIPLTIDAQSDPLDPATSLADVENAGYRLRRIVGKIFVSMVQNGDPAVQELIPRVLAVTAGIIVRRTEETTGQSLVQQSGQFLELAAPSEIRNYGDPWIWRRTWLLYNNAFDIGDNISWNDQGPTNNYTFGSGGVMDGPHVDAKTARIVGPEERLFLDVSATILSPPVQGGQEIAQVLCLTDLRILATMRNNVGNRRNASR